MKRKILKRKILNTIHRVLKHNCKHCRYCYDRNECDINIGLWPDYGYCYLFEKKGSEKDG